MSSLANRILVIAPQPFYQDRGTPIAVRHAIRALLRAGFEVDMATFHGGNDPEIPGLSIYRARSRYATAQLPIGLSWRKIVQHLSLYRLVRKLLATNRYAAIHAVEESVITARLASRHRDIPVNYDMHSWLSHELAAAPVLGRWPTRDWLRKIEKWMARGTSTIFCSAGLGATANELSGHGRVVEWLFPVQQSPLDSAARSAVRQSYGIDPDRKLIIYAGNLAASQNVSLLVDSALSVLSENSEAEIAIVGTTDSDREKLKRLSEDEHGGRVHLVERLPRKDALLLLAAADLALSLRVRGLNAPLKLFDYIGAGIPVVATDVHAHRVVLGDAAAYCEPVADDVTRAIRLLLTDRDRYAEIREKYSELAAGPYSANAFDATVARAYGDIIKEQPALTLVAQ